MKHNLIKQLCPSVAFILLCVCFYLMGLLVGLFIECLDGKVHLKIFYILSFLAATGIGYLDSKWINRHFVDGQWQ